MYKMTGIGKAPSAMIEGTGFNRDKLRGFRNMKAKATLRSYNVLGGRKMTPRNQKIATYERKKKRTEI